MSEKLPVQQNPLPDPVVIIQTGATSYDVSVSVDRVNCLCPESRSFLVWLLKRDSSETINLFLHTSSQPVFLGFASLIPLANAINMCKAKTIAYVDHIFDNISSYVLLAADELALTPFSMIQYAPLDNEASYNKAANAFAFYLVDRAVTRGYLSQEEANYIKSGRMVIKTPGKG